MYHSGTNPTQDLNISGIKLSFIKLEVDWERTKLETRSLSAPEGWFHGGDDRRPQCAVDIGETPSVFASEFRRSALVRQVHPEPSIQHMSCTRFFMNHCNFVVGQAFTNQMKGLKRKK